MTRGQAEPSPAAKGSRPFFDSSHGTVNADLPPPPSHCNHSLQSDDHCTSTGSKRIVQTAMSQSDYGRFRYQRSADGEPSAPERGPHDRWRDARWAQNSTQRHWEGSGLPVTGEETRYHGSTAFALNGPPVRCRSIGSAVSDYQPSWVELHINGEVVYQRRSVPHETDSDGLHYATQGNGRLPYSGNEASERQADGSSFNHQRGTLPFQPGQVQDNGLDEHSYHRGQEDGMQEAYRVGHAKGYQLAIETMFNFLRSLPTDGWDEPSRFVLDHWSLPTSQEGRCITPTPSYHGFRQQTSTWWGEEGRWSGVPHVHQVPLGDPHDHEPLEAFDYGRPIGRCPPRQDEQSMYGGYSNGPHRTHQPGEALLRRRAMSTLTATRTHG